MLSDLKFRLRALFRREAMERELDDELRYHLERETEKHVRAGMPRPDAERRARIEFGGVDRIKADTRDVRGIALLDAASQDIRYALRGLRSRPGFAAAIILTLALGIGANTAMFGIVDRLLLRPPAYMTAPERTHRVFLSQTVEGGERRDRHFAYTRYLDLREHVRSFDAIAAFGERRLAVGTGIESREMTVGAVSATFFDLFSARPVIGRFFTAAEDTVPVGGFVAVLGHAYWQTRYGGSPAALGQPLVLGSQTFRIIGVAPAGFVGMSDVRTPIAFIPITTFSASRGLDYHLTYRWQWAEVLVRRRPGVTLEVANAELTRAWTLSYEKESALYEQRGAPQPSVGRVQPRGRAEPLLLARGPEADRNSRIVLWVMGVTIIVLLIACANVANLLLARAISRRREVALRLALGVTRRRLVQQLLTETLVLAAIGGAAGIAVAQLGRRVLSSIFLAESTATSVASDSRSLLAVLLLTLVVAVLTGFAPAIQSLRSGVSGALKAGTREGTFRRSRLRTTLLVFQGAFSVVLLVGAGLFVRSLGNVRELRMGYDIEPVMYLEGNMRGEEIATSKFNALMDRLVAAATTIPGVRSASVATSVPFYSVEGRGAPIVPGRDSLSKLGRYRLQVGSPSYFQTAGTRIIRGRGFTPADRAGAPMIIVVNEAMAAAIWPGQDPLGRQLRFSGDSMPWLTVVGVAETIRGFGLSGAGEFWYYLPLEQYKTMFGPAPAGLFVRVDGRAGDHLETVRRRLQAEMPGNAYITGITLSDIVAVQQRSWKFGATTFVVFGALALILASIGLYAVIAYMVAQRTHELGVRIALGAGVSDIVRMIVTQGLAFAVAGVAIGSILALWAGRWIQPMLFAQSPRDPLIYGVVAGTLLLVAGLAALRPALRATRVDPTVALRAD